MRRTLVFVVVIAIIIASFGLVTPVSACSCAGSHPRIKLRGGDAAFVGRAVKVTRSPQSIFGGGTATWTFEVERAVKGRLRRLEVVTSSAHGASCGLEVALGERVGVIIYGDGDSWSSGLCSTLGPDELISASRAPPRPVGGEFSLLATADVGGSQILALDKEGRVVAYGLPPDPRAVEFGPRPVQLSVCPGNRVALEGTRDSIHVRDLSDLAIKATLLAPLERSWFSCVDEAGPEFLLISTFDRALEDTVDWWRGDEVLRSVKIAGQVVALRGDNAYVAASRNNGSYLFRQNLRTGDSTALAAFAASARPYPSPDGSRLMVVEEEYPAARLHSLDSSGAPLAPPRPLDPWPGAQGWIDNDTFLVSRGSDPELGLPTESIIFRPDLSEVRRVPLGLDSSISIAVVEGKVIGFSGAALMRLDPATGEVSRLGEVDSAGSLFALDHPRPAMGPQWVPEMPPLARLKSSGVLVRGRPSPPRSRIALLATVLVAAVVLGLVTARVRRRAHRPRLS